MAEHRYRPVGSAAELFRCRAPEVLLSGAAGTGKSRAALEKMHAMSLANPGMRGLICRKTATSLTSTALVTFREHVAKEALASGEVKWYGGSAQEAACYRYGNGSVIVVGGMDKATRIMSSEYDAIFAQEAIELTEEDWESLTTRLRNGVVSFQQLLADTNPGAPQHWLNQRGQAGQTVMIPCRHEDNPRLYDGATGEWTAEGAAYLSVLENLTGVRYLRLRKGLWAAAEGLIYETFDPAVHMHNPIQNPPHEWTRYLAVDFGFTNPFVCYDDQTEILTSDGWKLFAKLDRTESVATVNPQTRAVEWQRPSAYIAQDYRGPMITAESRRGGANFSVTPNHRMVLENRKRGGWITSRADEMPTGNYSIPVGWEPVGGNAGDDTAFARFLGLWLADGCLTFGGQGKKQRSIRIAQKNRIEAVRDVLAALGVPWTERENATGCIDFRINHKPLIERVFLLCGKVYSASKRVPAEFTTWGSGALEALLEGLMMGDGSPAARDAHGHITASERFITTSPGLADDVQAIAALLGRPTTRSASASSAGYSGLPITLHTVRFPVARLAALSRMAIRRTDYAGKVYCVTVPNGTVIVRRGGRPMVCGNCQWWAEDPDGRLYMYREIYMSGRLVEDHAKQILALVKRGDGHKSDAWPPREIICDHDAEDRATLERHLGLSTVPAHKAVSEGIQAVASRLKVRGDGKPGLYICRDALAERDPVLEAAHKPLCTADEVLEYIWDPSAARGAAAGTARETPLKKNDHGMDCTRYLTAAIDLVGRPRLRYFGPNRSARLPR